MTRKIRIALFAVPVLLGMTAFVLLGSRCAAYTSPEETSEAKDKVILETMMRILRQTHYDPTDIDDDFSHEAFDLYMERNDYNKKIFLQSDYDELKTKFYAAVDDEVKAQKFDFFNRSVEILNQRIAEDKVVYTEILAQPFDFTVQESVELDPEKMSYAKDEAERKENWRKYLKYQVMVRFADLQKTNKKDVEAKKSGVTLKSDADIEKEAREKVKKTQDDIFDRLAKVDRADRMGIYLNVVTATYDPHTEFFPPADKENFDISMSGQLQGIGATLQEKDGYIKVTSIVPGSPSWKDGRLKPEDKILKVAQGEKEPVDIVGMRIDDAIKLIRGKKGTEVRLTVEKPDGSTQEIILIRDIVVLEETYAQSAVIDQGKNKVGYIKLPSFYADFTRDKSGGRACAADVQKELEKLKAEKVSGVILDLRDNGGGSLVEVIKMVGLFIPQGPVVQVKTRAQGVNIYDDDDGGRVVYDGPLVVMINENSASASEILAAAIQDYKRGLIVGTYSRSFGKGTVQNFFDLDDQMVKGENEMKPLGSVKVTIQKFYRVNGGSTQLKGVAPDIQLPGFYSLFEYGEKDLDYPMEWDQVPVANYTTWKNAPNYDKLKKSSSARVAGNNTFALVTEKATQLKRERDITMESLLLTDFLASQKKIEEENKKFKALEEPVKGMGVNMLSEDKSMLSADTAKMARKSAFIDNLKKDAWVNECATLSKEMK
ncbi:MAG TPA: carboxy terminal-processing peptidase [Bacteroidia bacterium]|nr:carboxy terminal-processing peptidase [Bacteroidia bacterium]